MRQTLAAIDDSVIVRTANTYVEIGTRNAMQLLVASAGNTM